MTPTPNSISLQDSISRRDFFALSDADALHLIHGAFSPELERLKRAAPASESGICRRDRRRPSPSQLLFDAEYDEVNRTLTSVLALKWIITDDYNSFTGHQTYSTRLHPESFSKLRDLFLEDLRGPEDDLSLLVSIVIGDLGKDPNLAEDVVKVTGRSLEGLNHDMVVYEAAKAGLLPCLRTPDASQRDEIMLGLRCGSQLNVAQLAQAENVPGSLECLRILKGHEHAFALRFLEQLLDMAGAAGHVDPWCAKQLTEHVFQALTSAREALIDIIAGRTSLRAGYDKVLIERGGMLQKEGFRPLSVHIPLERALLRLLTMGRTADKEQAEIFADAFDSLPECARKGLVDGLNVDGYEDGTAIIPYYMPALISEALIVIPHSATPASDILSSLMRFLARVYDGTRPVPGQPSVIIERNLMFARDTIRSEAFKLDPKVLDQLSIPTILLHQALNSQ